MSVLFYGDEVSLQAGRVTARGPLIKAIQCSVVCQVTTSLHYIYSIHTISIIHRDSKEGLTQKHYCGDPQKRTNEANEKFWGFFSGLMSTLIGRGPYEFIMNVYFYCMNTQLWIILRRDINLY